MKKKVIIIPDSFKGCMTSQEVSSVIAKVLKTTTDFEYDSLPIADGGEGSVQCILDVLGGHKEYITVKSPENQDINAFYGITSDDTAVIEIAESSGITKQSSYNALKATTYGFGQLMKDALDHHCKTIYLCLGGSATTDCGCGMAAALGVRFYDQSKKSFIPTGSTLNRISDIDFSMLDKRIHETRFIVMSDVKNPICGPDGAAYVYSPQKGATPKEVELLDEGLRHTCELLQKNNTKMDLFSLPGGGAAGGAGLGCFSFLNAEITSGIESMLKLYEFDNRIEDSFLIVTGEGKLDKQSLMGKVLSGIKKHAKDIPITAFCGISDISTKEAEQMGIHVIEIGRDINLEDSMKNGKVYLREKAEQYFKGLNM